MEKGIGPESETCFGEVSSSIRTMKNTPIFTRDIACFINNQSMLMMPVKSIAGETQRFPGFPDSIKQNWNENALFWNVVIMPRHLQSQSIQLQVHAQDRIMTHPVKQLLETGDESEV